MSNHRHSHPIHLWSTDRKFECSECKEFGFRRFYHCAQCNVHMHEGCATALPFAEHPLQENCILEYRPTSTLSRSCDACGKTISGSRYRHKPPSLLSTSLNLHPRCVRLPKSLTSEGGGGGIKLHLVGDEWSKTLKELKCVLCSRNSFSTGWSSAGWSYVSPCGTTAYHVACVKDVIQDSFKKGFFDNFNNNNNKKNYYSYNNNTYGVGSSSPINQLGQRIGNQCASKIMMKIAFKLVFSAVLGDPTSIVADFVVESLF